MTPYNKLEEVINKALRFIRLEEDKKIQKRTNMSYDHHNRKNESSSEKYYRAKPYSKSKNHRLMH